jgi:hypothetical protein
LAKAIIFLAVPDGGIAQLPVLLHINSFCSVPGAPAKIKVNTIAFLGELLYSLNAASVSLPNVIKK